MKARIAKKVLGKPSTASRVVRATSAVLNRSKWWPSTGWRPWMLVRVVDNYGTATVFFPEKYEGNEVLVMRVQGLPHFPDASPHLTTSEAEVVLRGINRIIENWPYSGTSIEPASTVPVMEGVAPVMEGDRGFHRYGAEPLHDVSGYKIWLKESSAMGEPRCWIFCRDEAARERRLADHKRRWAAGERPAHARTVDHWPGDESDTPDTVRLDYAGALGLVNRLESFIAHVRAPEHWRNQEAS